MKNVLVCVGKGSVGKICLDGFKLQRKYKNYKLISISKKERITKFREKIKTIGPLKKIDFLIGFANISNLNQNKKIFDFLKNIKFKIVNFIHHTAIIDKDVKFGSGVKIFPGAIINRGCKIKNNVLINTGAIIEHDCEIGEHVQISPGTILAGNVKVGKLSFVGMGTKIIQGVKVGTNCTIGAGSVVLKDVPNNSRVAGIPVKKIHEKKKI